MALDREQTSFPGARRASAADRAGAIAILAFWSLSLVLPAQTRLCPNGDDSVRGWVLLLLGWLGPLDYDTSSALLTVRTFAWFANPLLLLNVFRMWRGYRPSLRGAIVAALLVLAALQPAIEYLGDEQGQCGPVTAQIGAWLWASAIVLGLVLTVRVREHAGASRRPR